MKLIALGLASKGTRGPLHRGVGSADFGFAPDGVCGRIVSAADKSDSGVEVTCFRQTNVSGMEELCATACVAP
jgi:hypothetical protein